MKKGDGFVLADRPEVRVEARAHKMSKARGNVISPDVVVEEYGADSLRLYEMFMGPLEAVKPWSMKGVEGVYRFLGRAWRMVVDAEADEIRPRPEGQATPNSHPSRRRSSHGRSPAVTDDLEAMRFNTAISKPDGVRQRLHRPGGPPPVGDGRRSRSCSPRWRPHLAEELWEILGHGPDPGLRPLADVRPRAPEGRRARGPGPDQRQAQGSKILVPADADAPEPSKPPPGPTSESSPLIQGEGRSARPIVIPGKLVNFVV